MTFAQLLSILKSRWFVAVSVLALVVAGTVGVSFLLPKAYTASASLLIEVKPDPLTAMMYGGHASPAYMQTQADIIQSERVALRVVRNLKLADIPNVRAQWLEETKGQGKLEDWLGTRFQRNMEIKPSRESNVITVSYKAPDPRFAAALANGFVQAYLDTSVDLRVDPAKQYSSFFETRTKEARETLEKAQANLSEFQRDKRIIATDERFDVESARLNELSSQLVMLQALSAESGSRQAQADGSSAEKMQEVLGNAVISGLKTDLARAQARQQELSARYGESHPQMAEARASISELRARIDAETKKVTGGVGVSNTIVRQRETQVRARLEAQRAQVLRMKSVRDEGQVLMRDVESAQRAYEAVRTRLNQTSLESQATQSNAYMLTQATPPLFPSSPRVGLNALIAVFLGTLLAFGVVLLMEFVDRRVRAVDDVVRVLGLPVLGVMPKPFRRRLFWKRGAPLMQQRVIGRLPGRT